MPKKKISSKSDLMMCEYSPSIYIDFENLSEIQGVEVGQEIYVVVKGTVESLTMRETGDKEPAASIRLCDFEAEISEPSSAIAQLFDDEEDD